MQGLEPIEIACGMALEQIRLPGNQRAGRPRPQPRGTARAALEQILLEALQRGPVSLSFSGGRDSSLLLALATFLARREGFADPLPITMRHESAESKEDHHQEVVVRHLAVREWVRVDVADKLDVLGDVATRFVLRAGIVAPPNAYLHLSMTDVAPPGTLLTGAGGDEILGTSGWRLAQVLTRRTQPRARDLALAAFALLPTPTRRFVVAERDGFELPWLRPRPAREVRRRLAADSVRTRLRWDVAASLWTRSRTQSLGRHALQRVAESTAVRIESPLGDPRFVAAFAGEVGMAGPISRDRAMRDLGHDILPEQILTRRSKASFGGLIWGGRFREFVENWDPGTMDPQIADLIDPEALRHAWRATSPFHQSMLLVQKAWLDQRAARAI